MTIRQQRSALADQLRSIAAKAQAEGRNLSDSEQSTVRAGIDQLTKWDDTIRKGDESADLIRRIAANPEPFDAAPGQQQYADWTAKGRRKMAAKIIPAMRGGIEGKALLPTGETGVAVPVLSDPVELNTPLPGLLSILPTGVAVGGVGKYLQQQGPRQNNAAVVPPGGLKPTTPLTLVAKTIALDVYAHVSEPVDTFALADNQSLTTFVADELLYGLSLAVSAALISEVLATSGVVSVPFNVDILGTLRDAVREAQELGVDPASVAFVLSPADWQAAETTKATGSGVYQMALAGVPVDSSLRAVWGVPVVVDLGLPTKTGLLIDRSSIVVYGDGTGAQVAWGMPGDTFLHNQIVARAEVRQDFAITRPGNQFKIATASVGP